MIYFYVTVICSMCLHLTPVSVSLSLCNRRRSSLRPTLACPGMQYLVLPGDGDTACDKLVVEVIVRRVKVDAFDCGELLDVKDVFTVHGPWLPNREREREMVGGERRRETDREKVGGGFVSGF